MSTQNHYAGLQPYVDPAKILEKYQYECDLVREDCAEIIKRCRESVMFDQTIMAVLYRSIYKLGWDIGNESEVVLINCNCNGVPNSEASAFSALRVQRLLHLPRYPGTEVVPVAFFCGQHPDGVYAWPCELALSLFNQILDRCRYVVDQESLRWFQDEIDPTSLTSVLAALLKLIVLLPRPLTLYLVIDGLFFFAKNEYYREEMKRIISGLVGLCRTRTGATLKFMFSSPVRLEFLEDIFEDTEILHLSAEMYAAESSSSGRNLISGI